MKKVFKELSILTTPFIFIIVFLFCLKILKNEFYYTSFLHTTYKEPYNWFYHYAIQPLKKLKINLFKNEIEYFPKVKVYVEESKLNALVDNLPNSTKEWKSAKILFENSNEMKKVKIRFRGDNPENWLINKSYRIKLNKKYLNNGQRYFDYLPYQDGRLLITSSLANNIGLIAPKNRIVELVLNEEISGLYLEQEILNESFLRRNKIMPVNFYKGEIYNQDTKLGLTDNLYANSGLWSKEAYLNFNEKDNKEDLQIFLQAFLQAKLSDGDEKLFYSYIDDDYIAKYLAYLVIAGDYHHTNYHNNRMILDPWKGKIYPVLTDPGLSFNLESFEFSSNDLISILNQNSKYLKLKYDYIHKFVIQEKLIDKEIEYLEKNSRNIVKTLLRDNRVFLEPGTNFFEDNIYKYFITLEIDNLKKKKQEIIQNLEKLPDATWKKDSNFFSINLKGQTPINEIILVFDDQTPDWVFIDQNYNGKFDNGEIKHFSKQDKTIKIDVTLFANRINFFRNLDNFSVNENNLEIGLTKFNFFANNNIIPSRILVKNKYSKTIKELSLDNYNIGVQTKKSNNIIFNNTHLNKKDINEKEIIISGNVVVDQNLVFENPVIINEGTKFYLKENTHIIFKNRVIARGSNEKKIIFTSFDRKKNPWGTIALIGKHTKKSHFENVEINGGSGGVFNQYIFTSMFSIHNTADIFLKNILLNNNYNYDDTLHIIYSNNITLDNVNFANAFGDALDIDISDNILIKNSFFENSKNDGIDSMESNISIENVRILNSGDKGVSVGESSKVTINNSDIEKNVIGIAVKDSSQSYVKKTKFKDNQNQISAYRKNLQYGNGGIIIIEESQFDNKINEITSESSKISIMKSVFKGQINKIGKNIDIK